MNALTAATIITLVLLSAALLVVWARRRNWLRALAIPSAITAAAASAAALGASLGFAVPLVPGLTAPSGDLPVLAAKLVRDKGIFITLDLPDEPRLVWMPWDQKMAEAIEEMLSNPDNAGVTAVVPPFEFSWDQHRTEFQPLPQPKVLPDKPPEPPKAPSFAA